MRKYLPNLSAREAEELPGRFVFLGGTVNGSEWRDKLISQLTVGFFNPCVADWTEDDIRTEEAAKAAADVLLYVITPKQHGMYVPVEMAYSVFNNRDQKIVIVFINTDGSEMFTEHQIDSNNAIKGLLSSNATVEFLDDLETTAEFLNKYLALENTEQV